MTTRRTAPLLAALLAGATLVACGDDGDDAADSTAVAAAEVTDAAAEVTDAAATEATDAPPATAGSDMASATADSGMASATADSGMASASTPSSGAAAEAGDIVDTAVAAGDFITLVAAVQAAGLEETLRGEGPFTVFAPTDDAFGALPEGTVDTLLEDPTGDLAEILTYHVVEGAVPAADVVELDGQEATTVNGATFTVNVADDGSVSLTDGAGNEVNVIQTDVMASNGVIHVIDGVLLPG